MAITSPMVMNLPANAIMAARNAKLLKDTANEIQKLNFQIDRLTKQRDELQSKSDKISAMQARLLDTLTYEEKRFIGTAQGE